MDQVFSRECGLCGCVTNARLRACCTQGRIEDLGRKIDANIARLMSSDQSDLDPVVVDAARKMLGSHKTPNSHARQSTNQGAALK